MSSQQDSKTFLIPLNLGSPARYDRSIFPLMRVKGKGSSLNEVDLVLQATMDELIKMKHMVGNSAEFKQLIDNAKLQYDLLLDDKEDLEKSGKTFNPMKMLSTYRSIRLLSEAGRALWLETRSTSEKLRRRLLSVDSHDMQAVDDDDLPPDACISAIAISAATETQMDGTDSLLSEAASFIGSQIGLIPDGDPFADIYEANDSVIPEHNSTASAIDNDGVALPTSPGASETSSPSSLSSRAGSGNNYFIFHNSYVASRSVIKTPTLNYGGSHNQGSCSNSPLTGYELASSVCRTRTFQIGGHLNVI
ncbi:hypothetical protein K503DRAFT_777036 [Rhizopogon vinicolor AM-OR11-026]|uniref:Uncharacterized protein n=1 Tax=Rhizopogon vinicolor AM-OR11-026 TaxID=1314800 RepID=A0A1B7MHI0_9AGAM|nr:hypothetical protein K503DRAFT_777036 [Rhizopogon vinicolor AM-OR11-026]